MERQRLAEWEKQRKSELMQHRQREQEKVLILKAKQEHINSDLEKLVNDMPCSYLRFVQAIMCLYLPANKEPLKRFFYLQRNSQMAKIPLDHWFPSYERNREGRLVSFEQFGLRFKRKMRRKEGCSSKPVAR